MNFWNQIHLLDQHLTLLINNIHSNFSDAVMQVFSNIPVWIPLYIAVVIFLFIRLGWKKALIITASIALTFGLCDQFSTIIKETVDRLRPCHDDAMISGGLRILEGKGGLYGFFSAHAANAFGFATASLLGFRNDPKLKYRGYATGIFFWAFMVSISRIFVGKHYFGDVIVGILVGTFFGLITSYIARLVIKKMKLSPSSHHVSPL